jgi:hypothetical protein
VKHRPKKERNDEVSIEESKTKSRGQRWERERCSEERRERERETERASR